MFFTCDLCLHSVVPKEVDIKKEAFSLDSIKDGKLTTENFEAEIKGKFEVTTEEGKSVLKLEEDTSIEMKPGVQPSCLFDFMSCGEKGLTTRFTFKFEKLEENTYYFGSGAESTDGQGIAMFFKLNKFHVVYSTETDSWFMSFKPSFVKLRQFCTFDFSFSKQEGLSVFVNNVLVGQVVESNKRVIKAASSVPQQLVIGKASSSTVTETKSEVIMQDMETFDVTRETLTKQGYLVTGMYLY